MRKQSEIENIKEVEHVWKELVGPTKWYHVALPIVAVVGFLLLLI